MLLTRLTSLVLYKYRPSTLIRGTASSRYFPTPVSTRRNTREKPLTTSRQETGQYPVQVKPQTSVFNMSATNSGRKTHESESGMLDPLHDLKSQGEDFWRHSNDVRVNLTRLGSNRMIWDPIERDSESIRRDSEPVRQPSPYHLLTVMRNIAETLIKLESHINIWWPMVKTDSLSQPREMSRTTILWLYHYK